MNAIGLDCVGGCAICVLKTKALSQRSSDIKARRSGIDTELGLSFGKIDPNLVTGSVVGGGTIEPIGEPTGPGEPASEPPGALAPA
jgi:hypothetical protein